MKESFPSHPSIHAYATLLYLRGINVLVETKHKNHTEKINGKDPTVGSMWTRTRMMIGP